MADGVCLEYIQSTPQKQLQEEGPYNQVRTSWDDDDDDDDDDNNNNNIFNFNAYTRTATTANLRRETEKIKTPYTESGGVTSNFTAKRGVDRRRAENK